MPSIHPSEKPALGWLVPCLAVKDLSVALDFYGKLDLVQYGGDVAEKWAMLRNRAIEIHVFQGHIPADLLNFRGGDLDEIRAFTDGQGLEVDAEEGPKSFILRDPDRREVFFDSSPEEQRDYESGQPLTSPVPGDDVHAGDGIDLGNMACCLACADLSANRSFYESLGLVLGLGEPEHGWAVMSRADHPPEFGRRQITTCVSLFQGVIPADTLNFRGGNVKAISEVLEERGVDLGDGVTVGDDGGESLFIQDPEGRPILFDTTPPERLYEA
jgi:catechol 2,3-dioxygenase-like lactoylglutathione lyase family enzyme